MFAFRGKYHPRKWKDLPKVFPQGIGKDPNRDAFYERASLSFRALAWGAAGALVGQSAGVLLGSWRSTQILKRDGNYENITRVMQKVGKDVMEQARMQKAGQQPFGTETLPPSGRERSLPPQIRRQMPGQQKQSEADDFYGRSEGANPRPRSFLSQVFDQDKSLDKEASSSMPIFERSDAVTPDVSGSSWCKCETESMGGASRATVTERQRLGTHSTGPGPYIASWLSYFRCF